MTKLEASANQQTSLPDYIVLVVVLKLISVSEAELRSLGWDIYLTRDGKKKKKKIIMDNIPRRVFTKIRRN